MEENGSFEENMYFYLSRYKIAFKAIGTLHNILHSHGVFNKNPFDEKETKVMLDHLKKMVTAVEEYTGKKIAFRKVVINNKELDLEEAYFVE